MRITLKVSSSGDCWTVSVPKVRLSECYRGDEFDEAAFRRQVRDYPSVQIGSEDRGPVCAFASLLLSALGEWLDDNDKNADGAKEKAAKRIKSRMKRDLFAYARINLQNATVEHKGKLVRTVIVGVEYDDNDVPMTENFARDCASIVLDFCQSYSRRFTERDDPPLLFRQSPTMDELFAELKVRKEQRLRKESNENRLTCERHRSGFCSPSKFDCPHYKDGKCIEI